MFSNVMKFPDSLLNRVSMYRLVIYYLGALLGIALVQSWRVHWDIRLPNWSGHHCSRSEAALQ